MSTQARRHLTIDDVAVSATTEHADYTGAHRALLQHLIDFDRYLRPLTAVEDLATFQLIAVDEDGRNPYVSGLATITMAEAETSTVSL